MNVTKCWLVGVCLLGLFLAGCGGQATPKPVPPTATAEKITLHFFGTPANREMTMPLLADFTQKTGLKVEYVMYPESPTEGLARLVDNGKRQSAEIDIYEIDVIWPSIVEPYMLDLNQYLAKEAKAHFPAIIENNTVKGKLIGMPYYTDVGLLYYRTDLLKKYGFAAPPQTWDELTKMAQLIQDKEHVEGNSNFWGFVWQGAAYEGLTCNALEWQVSFGGGRVIEPDGTITVNNPKAIAAFKQANRWIGTISPPNITGYKEEDGRSIWQAGSAAFMRGWPYAYALGQAQNSIIKGRFAVTRLPSGGAQHADTLGGWQFAISKFSKHPAEAAELIKFLSSVEGQKKHAIIGSFLPTIPELYDDPEVLAVNPYYADLKAVFLGGAVARPSTATGELYGEVSQLYFTAVHDILTDKATAEAALADLEAKLVKLTGGKTGQP